eukprot:10564361-Ditylum_brightwellii.AAC.1
MNKNQALKIYKVFNCCEDIRGEGKPYDGKQNLFTRPERKILESDGIEGKVIVNILQSGGNFCGTSEVVNH